MILKQAQVCGHGAVIPSDPVWVYVLTRHEGIMRLLAVSEQETFTTAACKQRNGIRIQGDLLFPVEKKELIYYNVISILR